jgi:hypothetical protein
VPIVPAAILFDLAVGDAAIRPDAECGYLAAQAATTDPVEIGDVGAGAGATVGKLAGIRKDCRGCRPPARSTRRRHLARDIGARRPSTASITGAAARGRP